MKKKPNCDLCTSPMKFTDKTEKLRRYECPCCGNRQVVFTAVITKDVIHKSEFEYV